jgi:hypothetical protein
LETFVKGTNVHLIVAEQEAIFALGVPVVLQSVASAPAVPVPIPSVTATAAAATKAAIPRNKNKLLRPSV